MAAAPFTECRLCGNCRSHWADMLLWFPRTATARRSCGAGPGRQEAKNAGSATALGRRQVRPQLPRGGLAAEGQVDEEPEEEEEAKEGGHLPHRAVGVLLQGERRLQRGTSGRREGGGIVSSGSREKKAGLGGW